MGPRAHTQVPEARIKGAAFRELLRFYVQLRGPERLLADARAIDPEKRHALDLEGPVLGIVASSWYPASTVHALLDEMTRGLSDHERRELATAGSRAVMSATLRGLYRVLFQWMASPERYAKYAPKLWESYYDAGSIEIQPHSSGLGAVATIRNWSAHHPFICELNRGASVAIYTAMGCKQVECDRVACVSEGKLECRFITRWTSSS